MINKEYRTINDLRVFYLPTRILKSFLTGFIFFILPTTLLVTLTVNIVSLYFYNVFYFLLGLYIILTAIAFFTNRIVIDTLKNYNDHSDAFDYKNILVILTVTSSIVIFILFIIASIIIF